ncbi:hypothetical protein PCASD_24032 [Puccinia coronata f. sp. avenae]|nr:hypothetical protein PCASD_24032 [Puccinia coronata f. sp. avenae]
MSSEDKGKAPSSNTHNDHVNIKVGSESATHKVSSARLPDPRDPPGNDAAPGPQPATEPDVPRDDTTPTPPDHRPLSLLPSTKSEDDRPLDIKLQPRLDRRLTASIHAPGNAPRSPQKISSDSDSSPSLSPQSRPTSSSIRQVSV